MITEKNIEINPKKVALIAGAALFASAATCAFLVFLLSAAVLKSELRDDLLETAKTAAIFTNGDLHKKISSPDDKTSDNYKTIQSSYRKIIKSNPKVKYIYTLILKNGKPHFIVDSQIETDNAGQAPAEVMEEYTDYTTEMLEALVSQTAYVEDQAYTDKWGTFLSAYVPFYDNDNKFIGIVGADIDISQYNKKHEGILLALGLGLILATVLGLIAYFIVLEASIRNNIRLKYLLSQNKIQAVDK